MPRPPMPAHPETPTADEHNAALAHPNAFLYRSDAGYDPDGRVPPEAIQGAWAIDEHGEITGPFQPNPNYRGHPAK